MSTIGIDLGAHESRVALVREGKPRIIPDEDGRLTLPSVVAPGPGGAVVAGYAARVMPGAHHVMWALRRGQALSDPERAQRGVAALITALARRVERITAQPVAEAVITVPAGLDNPGRRLIRAAGAAAGVEVIRLMREGTAAALRHLVHHPDPGVFAVVDFGGSRFDVTVFQAVEDTLSVLAADEDAQLGGVELDHALACALMHESGVPWAGLSQAARDRATAGARQVRQALSDRFVAPFSCVPDTGPPLRHPVSRDQMEAALSPWLGRIQGPCRAAMLQADVRPGTLDAVLLVGGLARMPRLKQLVRDVFQLKPTRDEEPAAAVVEGAAIQADLMSGPELSGICRVIGRHPMAIEGAPWSLGLESVDGTVEILIPRGSPLPASSTRCFYTWVDGQRRIDIPLVLGDGQPRWLCCEGLRAGPAGCVAVEATFMVDPDGMLSWSARDPASKAPLPLAPAASVQLSAATPAPLGRM